MNRFEALENIPSKSGHVARGRCRAYGRACVLLVAVAALLFLVPWRAGAHSARKAGSTPAAAKARGSQNRATKGKTASAEAGDAARGKKLFVSFGCFECHGHMAEGSVMTGPRLAPDPVSFSDFSDELRHPINQMPPYTAKVVSEQDLRDIYAFLKSVPQPPTVKTIPELQ